MYRVYGSMDELRADVLDRAGEVAMSYLRGEGNGHVELPFLQLGLGSLEFAQREPHLFDAVGRSGLMLQVLREGEPLPEFVVERMRGEPLLANLSDDQIRRIHALLWFFSQGLATLFVSDVEGDPMPMAQELLMQAGRAVIAFELSQPSSPGPSDA
ncbi:MAG: hypothetical protein JRI68_22445 [Deltaproteobacteria bacterium]|nr:hypothetical protein [Deltaproteobacteria bacterium]